MKIRTKIFLSLLSMFTMLILVIAIFFQQSKNVDFYRKNTIDSERQLLSVTALRAQVRNQLLDTYAVLFVEGLNNQRDRLAEAHDLVLQRLADCSKAWENDVKFHTIQRLYATYEALNSEIEEAVELASTHQINRAKIKLLDAKRNKFENEFVKDTASLIDDENKEVLQNSLGLENSIHRLHDWLIFFAVAGFLLAVFLTVFVSKSIADRLRRLEAATELISEGELQISLPARGSDELAVLARAFNKMASNLSESKDKLAYQQTILFSASKMSALGEMAGGIAHEINNPLAIIRTLSTELEEISTEERIDKALIKKLATTIVTTSDRIAKIIQGLRFFSRDATQDPYQRVNVYELVQQTLTFCVARFEHRGIKLVVEDFNHGLCFDGRATEISQVLLNLLNNAHDAIGNSKEPWIKISVREEKSYLQINIANNGDAIPTEIQEKMFQPFFTTKEIGKGTGLGLGISLGIIRGHQGELKLDTQCSNTCFVVRLPLKQTMGSALIAA